MPTQPAGTIRMIATGTFQDAVFSPDGSTLYASHGGTITGYNVATGSVTGNWALGTALGGIDVSTDGHTLVATERQLGPSSGSGPTYGTDVYVYKLDLTSGARTTFTSHVTNGDAEYYDVSMQSDGKALLTENYSGSGWVPLTTLDLTSGAFSTSTQSYAQAAVLVATADRTHILVGPQNISDEPLYMYTVGSGQTARHDGYADNVMGYNNGVQAISPTGNFVAQGPGLNIYDGSLHFITSLSRTYLQFGNDITGMAFSPTGDLLYMLDSGSKSVIEFETAHWNVLASFSVQTDIGTSYGSYGNNLLLSPDGHILSVIGSAGIELINLSTVVADGGTSGNDSLAGTSYGDEINGFGGNDTIDGGAGADTMNGGAGNDIYYVDNYSDQVNEYQNEGIDIVFASVNYTIGGSVEELILSGTFQDQQGYGSGGNDIIQGSDLDNGLNGYGGNDTLLGAGGNDVIVGGDGDDSIRGGAGNDQIISGQGNDTVTGGSGTDTFEGDLSGLSGDAISDLSAGDRIQVDGVGYSSFTYHRAGGVLQLGTSPLAIGTADVRLVVAQASNPNSVQLVAANRMSGIADFDGDGHSDILWRNANGAVSTWSVTGNAMGNSVHQSVFNSSADASWKIVETGDFNGDAASDILWRNASTGQVAIWHATGDGSFAGDYLHAPVDQQWQVAAVGDLNGDGKDDLLWHSADGSLSGWTSTPDGFDETVFRHGPVDTSWKVEGLGDFNGDGKADILWRQDSGAISTWTNNGTSFNELGYFNSSVGTDWHISGIADFNGDGMDDILWRHANGSLSIWTSNGTGFNQAAYNHAPIGTEWTIAAVGDFNDDGKADLLWHNANGGVSTWQSTGTGFIESVANSYAPPGWSIIEHSIPL